MLTAASIPNYTALSAGAFNGLAQCYTFCSEPHWDSNTINDTTITNRVVSFVNSGGNFFGQCFGLETYENYSLMHSATGVGIQNAAVTNAYYNDNLAYMQFQGTVVSNQAGAVRNWVKSSAWKAGFYYGVSHATRKDTIVAAGAHIIAANTPGGNVFYQGGHDYLVNAADYTDITHLNAVRMYLNAALVPSNRPTPFVADAGISGNICIGQSVQLGGSPTGPASASYSWTPAAGLNSSTISNPIATPTVSTTYQVSVDNGGCPASAVVTVTVNPTPTANAGNDVTVCPGNSAATLSGTVVNATGGTWGGGAGTYNPSKDSLNTIYTPSAAEIASGSVTL